MKILTSLLAGLLIASAYSSAEVLIDDNFDAGTPGDNALTDANRISPTNHTTTNGAVFVGQTPFEQSDPASYPATIATNPFSGNGVWIYDLSSDDGTRYRRPFADSDVVLIQFNVQIADGASTSVDDYITLRVANPGDDSQIGASNNDTPFNIDIRNNGTLRVKGSTYETINAGVDDGTLLSVYINTSTSSATLTDFTGSQLTIAGSEFVVYTGNTKQFTTGFDDTVDNFIAADGLGNVIFNSSTTVTGGSIVIDNLKVESFTIPEASDVSMIFGAAALLLLIGRCRRRR